MTGAPLPPEEDLTVKEEDGGASPSAAATASQPAATHVPHGPTETVEAVDCGNRTLFWVRSKKLLLQALQETPP